jgi:hypothetical protein
MLEKLFERSVWCGVAVVRSSSESSCELLHHHTHGELHGVRALTPAAASCFLQHCRG